MTGLEITRFDQTAVLLASFSIFALIRERKVLPFLISLVGGLLQGPLVSSAMAALIAWHRIERGCGKWIHLKDFAAIFCILAGAIAPEAEKALFSWLGVFLIALNFGGSALGTLPALLFLRQYHPNPEFLEVALVGHALYWILVEASRWTEIPSGHLVLSWAELFGSILVLLSFKVEIEAVLSDPALAVIGSIVMLLVFSLFVWVQIKPQGFQGFYQSLRNRLGSALFWGGRFVSGQEPWAGKEVPKRDLGFRFALNSFFWWVVGLSLVAALSWLLSRGVSL